MPQAAEIHQSTVDWYLANHPDDGAETIARVKEGGLIKVIDEQKGGINGSNLNKRN
jgi:hypothetical protein